MLLNRRDFKVVTTEYSSLQNTHSENKETFLSICIPMRNEEDNANRLLPALLNQWDSSFEILILDDQSTDSTNKIVSDFIQKAPISIQLLNGSPKPDGWLGKPWACHQLSHLAKGEIIIFIDADTLPSADFVRKIRNQFLENSLDAITVWPVQELNGFWQSSVLPLVYYALLTLLPFRYIRRKPRWMPSEFYEQYRFRFSAANGQCIAFRRSVYDQIGGHERVKDKIVEDVSLARNVRSQGFNLRMYPGNHLISCRMYTTHSEMNEGFKKNFLAGFDNHIPLFIGMAVLHLIVFILPFVLLIGSVWCKSSILIVLSSVNILLLFTSRLILNSWFKWTLWKGLLHPIGVLWFQVLGIQILWDTLTGRKMTWKGRELL